MKLGCKSSLTSEVRASWRFKVWGRAWEGMADKAGEGMADKTTPEPAEGETGWKTLPGRCLSAAETQAELFYARVIGKMGQNLGLCIVISGGVLFLVRDPARSP
jgi:hypothetical protein